MRDVIREARKFAKLHNCKVLFKPIKGAVAGYCDLETDTVTINSYLSSRSEILSALAHELSHCIAYRKGLWQAYHDNKDDMMKTAIKAERYIDRMAERLLFEFDARVRYLGAYLDSSNEEIKEFLENYYADSKESP